MSEVYRDEYVRLCPYCGGSEMLEAFQAAYGAVSGTGHKMGGVPLYHSVCRRCGSVVRSFVREPEKLLRRRDRKEVE